MDIELKNEVEKTIEGGKEYLMNNDLKGFYNDYLFEKCGMLSEDIANFTEYFLEKGANPLEYMDYVPTGYLAYSELKSVIIPPNIQELGIDSFAWSNLESVEILGDVTVIREGAFQGCDMLKSIKLPDTIEEIENEAFYDCSSLTDINVPKNLKKVSVSAFSYCPEETFEKFCGFM